MIFCSPTNSWAFFLLDCLFSLCNFTFWCHNCLNFSLLFSSFQRQADRQGRMICEYFELEIIVPFFFFWSLNNSRWIETGIRVVYTDLQFDSWNSVPNCMLKFLINSMILLNKHLLYYPVLLFIVYLIN